MTFSNAMDYRYVKRAVYDKFTDRLESKLQRMKADIREIEQALAVTLQTLKDIEHRAAVFVQEK